MKMIRMNAIRALAAIITGMVLLQSCTTSSTGVRQKNDWLINGDDYISTVTESSDGRELVISNGLVKRVFRITPDFATTGIHNLVTGESLIRAVRPEAKVTINGEKFNIGGLVGQPVQNYLLEEWIDGMTADAEAFSYAGYTVSDIKPRFDWKQRKEWISGDVRWPAPGKEVVIGFKAPDLSLRKAPRKVLYSDNFTKLDAGWKIFKGGQNQRNSFINEGKPGEIMAEENVAVYAERELPPDATAIECIVSPGTDRSNSHCTGIVLVYPDRNMKLSLKPRARQLRENAQSGKFGVWDGVNNWEFGSIKDGVPYYLRMKLFNNNVLFEVSEDGKEWEELNRVYSTSKPVAVRVGKTDRSGGNRDSRNGGELERSHIKQVMIYGEPLKVQAEQSAISGTTVKVHYEIYDGLPLISKWITIENKSDNEIVIDKSISEIIATVEAESSVEGEPIWEYPNMHVETDFAFSGMSNRKANSHAVHWKADSTYTSQVNYALKTPCLLEIHPEIGPAAEVKPGETFESIRAWELFFDSYDKERKGLAQRKMFRTIAPWVTEEPILMHVRFADEKSVKLAVDQCAEVGFEMVIMTFGSGFNMETGDTAYYARMKKMADYAHSKGIALGGYSLLASRSVGEKDDVVNPATGKPGGIAYYGNSPCLGSEWGNDYFRKIKELYEHSGLDIIEHDGSYPGDICGSEVHPGHKGLDDSQWKQFQVIKNFYQWCRSRGIYLNVPDWYFINGSTKVGMGYREVNWSLPRAQQEIIERQNIFDGTWTKTPAMGWMMVPLTEYHGGGKAATIEPLSEHLDHYSLRMANLFGAGVQACYRGPRLYDTLTTKNMVKGWVDFYKEHRRILESDVIHLRRPDGISWDGLLHVDPKGVEKGLLMLYNPTGSDITEELAIPVYYTGLGNNADVEGMDGKSRNLKIDRDYNIHLDVKIPAHGYAWYIIK